MDALIGAGASLLGGLFDSSSANKANAQQMDLAKNSISYRVEDAKRAGIHPLYALGAPTLSSTTHTNTMGQSIADAGSKIAKGISNGYEKQLQAKNLESITADINLKNAQTSGFIQEQKIASDLARVNQTGRTAGNPNHLTIGGGKVHPSKDWSDTQKIEDRYGDLVSWLYGLGVVAGDSHSNVKRKVNAHFKNKGKVNPRLHWDRRLQEYVQY